MSARTNRFFVSLSSNCLYTSFDLLKSVERLCFYEVLDLLIKCTRAFEQESTAQRSTRVDISSAVCLCVHAGGSGGECKNAFGFWGFLFFFLFLKERELFTSAQM